MPQWCAQENGDAPKDAAASSASSAQAAAGSGGSGVRAKQGAGGGAAGGLAGDKGGSAPGAVQLNSSAAISMGLKVRALGLGKAGFHRRHEVVLTQCFCRGACPPPLPVHAQALPEGSSHTTDELLSRTRRRSDNGYGPGLHHSHTSDDVMQLGAGGSGSAALTPFPLFSSSAAAAGSSNLGGANAFGAGPAAPSGAAAGGGGGGGTSSWFSWFSKPSAGAHGAQGGLDDGLVGGLAGVRGRAAAAGGAAGGGASPRTEQEEIEVEVIRRLVDSYFAIVKRNLADGVPKAIMHFMVNSTKRGLQQHLIQQLYK